MIMINAGEKKIKLNPTVRINVPWLHTLCYASLKQVHCLQFAGIYTQKFKKKKKKRSDQYAGVYSRDSSSCHIHSWSRINLDVKLIIMIAHMIGGCMKYQIVSFLLHAINLYTVWYLLELICGIIPQYLLRLNFWGMLSMLSIPMSFWVGRSSHYVAQYVSCYQETSEAVVVLSVINFQLDLYSSYWTALSHTHRPFVHIP